MVVAAVRGAIRRRHIATVVGFVAIALGLTGVVAPASSASVPSGGGWSSTKDADSDHPIDSDKFHEPKCDSNGYDHDHYGECDEPPPAPPPTPPAPAAPAPAAPASEPEEPSQPSELFVAPVLAASIYTGTIDCGDTATEPSTADSAGVNISRLPDAFGDCVPSDYVINATEDSVQFLKNGSPYAQFVMSVTWRSELEPPQVSTTFADFELVEGGYEFAMPRCPAALFKKGKLTGLSALDSVTPASLAAFGITDMDGLPGATSTVDNGLTQYACVGDRGNKFVDGGDPHYELTQEIYILGDIYIRR